MSNYIRDLILLIVFYILGVNCMRAASLSNFSKRYSVNSAFRQNALYLKNSQKDDDKKQSPRNDKRIKKSCRYKSCKNN